MKIKKIIASILLVSLACVFSGCSNTARGLSQDAQANTKAVKRTINS